MSGLAQPRLISQILRLLPPRLLASLDAWSYRVAQKRAAERRRRSC